MAKTTPATPKRPAFESELYGIRVRYEDRETQVTHRDRCNTPIGRCSTQAAKLFALTSMINGEGFDVFEGLAEQIKRDLVWLLDDLAQEVLALASAADQMPEREAVIVEVSHD